MILVHAGATCVSRDYAHGASPIRDAAGSSTGGGARISTYTIIYVDIGRFSQTGRIRNPGHHKDAHGSRIFIGLLVLCFFQALGLISHHLP